MIIQRGERQREASGLEAKLSSGALKEKRLLSPKFLLFSFLGRRWGENGVTQFLESDESCDGLCPEPTQNFADNFGGTAIHGCQVKNPCSIAINSFQNANIKQGFSIRDTYTPDLLNHNFHMYWNPWETLILTLDLQPLIQRNG